MTETDLHNHLDMNTGQSNYTETAKRLINNKEMSAINSERNGDGDSYMHLAIKANNLELVKFLVEKDSNIYAINNIDESVFNYAAKHKDGEIMEYLLKQKPESGEFDINLDDKTRKIPLNFDYDKARKTPLDIAYAIADADTKPADASKILDPNKTDEQWVAYKKAQNLKNDARKYNYMKFGVLAPTKVIHHIQSRIKQESMLINDDEKEAFFLDSLVQPLTPQEVAALVGPPAKYKGRGGKKKYGSKKKYGNKKKYGSKKKHVSKKKYGTKKKYGSKKKIKTTRKQ